MRERRVIIPLSVRLYMDEIADHIIELSRPEHAVRYVHEMVADMKKVQWTFDSEAENKTSFPTWPTCCQSRIPPTSNAIIPKPNG